MTRRRTRRNPPGYGAQVAIGVATAVVASVLAALIIDEMRERRARAPLPQGVAPGWDSV
jgi:hypothetical protein